jgi:cytochrome c oxidase assembly factor CtaG
MIQRIPSAVLMPGLVPLTDHAVPAPLSTGTAVTSWTLDPGMLALVVLAGGGYLWAVRRLRRRGWPWPTARVVAFCVGGLGSIVLATMSAVGAYQDVLFSLRAVQVIVLLMVSPLGLALGAPITLVLELLPERARQPAERMLRGRVARALTFPAAASALLVATPWVLYFTDWYPAVLRSAALDELLKVTLLAIGFLYFYSRLQLDPVPRRYHHLISVTITLVEVIFDAALGLTLWLGGHLVAADYYQALGRTWGPSLRTDQILGAGALWLIGDLAGLPFLGALMHRMVREDEREAAEVDRELDQRQAARRAAGGAAPAERAADQTATDGPELMRPWWEDDPILAERFRRD